MPIGDTFKQRLGGDTAIKNASGVLNGIRARLDELAREEAALLSSDEAPDVLERNYKTWIEDVGRRWIAAHGKDVVRGGSSHIERSPGPAPARPAARVVGPRPEDVVPGIMPWDMFCAGWPDLALAGLRRIVEQTPYEPGPAAATGPARLEVIADERKTLQRRHAELVDQAEAEGLHAEHLPEEVGARFRKAQRRGMWEADVRMNREYYERVPSARPPEPEA